MRKNREETRQRILTAATGLFLEKGYEETTIQEIVANLGGLTKGAVYHHFPCKEDILQAVLTQAHADAYADLDAIRAENTSGREKLVALLRAITEIPLREEIYRIVPDYNRHPQLLCLRMRFSVRSLAPEYLLPVLAEGAEDGSLRVKHPAESAELLALLADIWLVPMLFPAGEAERDHKLELFWDAVESLFL